MKIIFHNDDFGLNNAFTDGILFAFNKGVTTSTSIRTDGTDYKNAVNQTKKHKNLGLGLHFNITDGKQYKYNFLTYWLMLFIGNKKLLAFVESDIRRQFDLVVNRDKLVITHINSQDHVHMIPIIFELTCKLCQEYNINYIRLVNEPIYLLTIKSIINGNLLKNLLLNYFSKTNIKTAKKYKVKHADYFYGTLFTDNMTVDVIKAAIEDGVKRKAKIIEILSHPTVRPSKSTKFTSDFIKKYTYKPNRLLELKALLSKDLMEYLTNKGHKLTYYGK